MKIFAPILVAAIAISLVACQSGEQPATQSAITYTNKAVEKSIDSLIRLMTLEEKIGQLNQYSGGFEFTGPTGGDVMKKEDIEQGRVGSMLNVLGAENTREYQKAAVEKTRLGIPLVFGYDVIHGFKTIFPLPLAEAATFDLAQIEENARIAALEASAAGVHWTFAPMMDIARDARWGRIAEGAGEDTWYGSLVAAARVKGFQGQDLAAHNTLAACAKHFMAYGAAQGGRDYNTVDVSKHTLHETYLPPFRAATEAGVATFMTAFNEIDGIPSTGNPYLFRKLLREELKFDGMVLSDWGAVTEMLVHGFAADTAEAAQKAIEAGVDMDMEGRAYRRSLAELVKAGKVPEKLIDEAVAHVLRLKFRLGLFEDPYRYCNPEREKELLLHPDHLAAARKSARESMVLLKNQNQLLPLPKTGKTIALIGPLADSQQEMIGCWSAQGEGKDAVSVLQGIKNVAPDARIIYAKGCEILEEDEKAYQTSLAAALAAARQADVIVAAMGEGALMSGEAASRTDIGLPGRQTDLLKALHATGKPIVLVLFNGRPLELVWHDKHLPSILEAWFGGTQAGNAIADVLFGDYNPSGRLPVSFPYTVGQVPIHYNMKQTGRPPVATDRYTSKYLDAPNYPLYPFGYGLSYTTFEYGAPSASSTTMEANGSVTISVQVRNTGSRTGEELVQLYIHDLVASVTRPVKELRGFQKVKLEPGQAQTVNFTLTPKELAFVGQDLRMRTEPGKFKVMTGPNARDLQETSFELK